MRLFVALVPPPAARAHLADFLEPRRTAGAFRWSEPEQAHVTLAFAGAVPEARLDDLIERVAAAASRRTPVTVRLAGGGAFPDVPGARVLWTGVAGADAELAELAQLSAGCRTAVTTAGVEVDGGRFVPHVTVARLPAGMSGRERAARREKARAKAMAEGRRPRPSRPRERGEAEPDATRWVRVLETYDGPTWTAASISVVESHLGQGRPRHEVVAELPLGRAG